MTAQEHWENLLFDEIDRRRNDLLALASELIRVPSENPGGSDVPVAQLIERRLGESGLTVSRHDAGPERANVIATSGGTRRGARSLALVGHHDVVPVGEHTAWTRPPFSGDLEDGFLHGRGASDMKAGLAAMMFVASLVHKLGVPLAGGLSVVSVGDEETAGPHGLRHLLAEGLLGAVTSAIIGEPSARAHPTIGQRGSAWFRLHTDGTAGHGSLQPFEGVSANLEAARAIVALQALTDLWPEPDDSVAPLIASSVSHAASDAALGRLPAGAALALRSVSINVGVVSGGSSANVIAERCVVDIDVRIPIGLSHAHVMEEAQRILRTERIDARIEPIGLQSEPNWTLPHEPIVESVVGAVRTVTSDQHASGVLQWGSSDARSLRDHGIPVLQYGPADLPSVHAIDERVSQERVIEAAKVYAASTIRYLGLRA